MKKKFLFVFLLLPLVYIIYSFMNGDVVDIADFLYLVSGNSAIFILFATTFASVIKMTKFRKTLGLFAFFYAFLHFSTFAILENELDIASILEETVDKKFIYLGSIAFMILIFLAITSFKKLFVKFNKFHKLIYLAIILVFIHSIMSRKSISIEAFPIIIIFVTLLFFKIRQFYKKMI